LEGIGIFENMHNIKEMIQQTSSQQRNKSHDNLTLALNPIVVVFLAQVLLLGINPTASIQLYSSPADTCPNNLAHQGQASAYLWPRTHQECKTNLQLL
jgi:hypothetical protein